MWYHSWSPSLGFGALFWHLLIDLGPLLVLPLHHDVETFDCGVKQEPSLACMGDIEHNLVLSLCRYSRGFIGLGIGDVSRLGVETFAIIMIVIPMALAVPYIVVILGCVWVNLSCTRAKL